MKDKKLTHKLDWSILIIPAIVVLALCAAFMLWPARSDAILQAMRGFVGDTCGMFFSVLSLGFLACTLYIAFSKYGKIRLGNTDKPQYTNFQWSRG